MPINRKGQRFRFWCSFIRSFIPKLDNLDFDVVSVIFRFWYRSRYEVSVISLSDFALMDLIQYST